MKGAQKRARLFSDLGIRNKLFVSYVLLVLFFLLLSLTVSSVLVVRQNRTQVLRTASHVLGQTSAYIQYKTESVRILLSFLATSAGIQDLFERHSSYYQLDIGRWPIDAQAFERMAFVTVFNPDIVRTSYYMRYGLASVFHNQTFIPFSEAESQGWYEALVRSDRRVIWFMDVSGSPPVSTLHAVRGVLDSQDISRFTGVIRFDVAQDMVRGPLANALPTESTSAWIRNTRGELIASAGVLPATGLASLGAAVGPLAPSASGESWETATLDGRRYLVGTQGIEGTDWVLSIALPYGDILRMSSRPAQSLLLVLVAVTPLSLALAFYVSRSATRRIDRLIRRMDGVVEGDFSRTLDPGNADEIGRLTTRFNDMVAEIGQLVEEKYRLGKEVKSLELKALQAQINPHFLYNTLDLINWMSLRYGASEIGTLVGALSRFYKLSLGRGEDTVRLADELEHARTYVQIQNMRYDNAITLAVAVPEEILDYRVLKLVIQPLVENAIVHGIMQKPVERGTVRIQARRVDGEILLTIQDDGMGMSDEVSAGILVGAGSTDGHGYGVRNVHERLQLSYGPLSGLTFRSEKGLGTTVTIRLPAVKAAPTPEAGA